MVKYIKKTITIRYEQAKWIENNAINLSRFVQKSLEKSMRKN